MDRGRSAGGLLVAALGINLAWLWLPLGFVALALASYVLVSVTRDRWSRWLQVGVLVVAWLPFGVLVAVSGIAVGAGGEPLFALGGSGDLPWLRAASGAVVPLMAAGLLAMDGQARTRKLAQAALGTWLVLVPAAVIAGDALVPDVESVETTDPPGGVWVEIALVAPIVLAYGLTVAAAAVAWREG